MSNQPPSPELSDNNNTLIVCLGLSFMFSKTFKCKLWTHNINHSSCHQVHIKYFFGVVATVYSHNLEHTWPVIF